ncbi:hypothetical protein ACLOJK_007709 [Asimina triloba]
MAADLVDRIDHQPIDIGLLSPAPIAARSGHGAADQTWRGRRGTGSGHDRWCTAVVSACSMAHCWPRSGMRHDGSLLEWATPRCMVRDLIGHALPWRTLDG